jgi:hypothetical protein
MKLSKHSEAREKIVKFLSTINRLWQEGVGKVQMQLKRGQHMWMVDTRHESDLLGKRSGFNYFCSTGTITGINPCRWKFHRCFQAMLLNPNILKADMMAVGILHERS